jgi:hypothetical protein
MISVMPKPRGGVFRAQVRDERYAALIAASSPPHHAWNTEHVTPPLETWDQALDIKRGVFRSARHAGISAHHVEIETIGRGPDKGRFRVHFQLTTKAAGRAAIAAHVNQGGALAYNVRRDRDRV